MNTSITILRDPRAVLFSQAKNLKRFDREGRASKSMNWKKNWKQIWASSAPGHCGNLTEDVGHFKRLRSKFPGQIKAIRYEDGAIDPQGYTRDIYDFLGKKEMA